MDTICETCSWACNNCLFWQVTMRSPPNIGASPYSQTTKPPTTSAVTAQGRPGSGSVSGCECDMRSQLEEEATAAVREFSFAVHSVCISEMLPRTNELLFLNLTTLERTTYCLELTAKGWRIASNRADCMNGDFRQLHLHTQYFESLSQLLDSISPLYREKFGVQLINKLNNLEKQN